MTSLLAQLKQRQVFKVATIYAVSAWPLIQIADLAVPALGLPDSVMTLLLQIFLVGFPISLIFAWLYNFTSKGIISAQAKADNNLSVNDSRAQVNIRTTIAIAGTLVIALFAVLGSQFLLTDKTEKQQSLTAIEPVQTDNLIKAVVKKKESIAILPFIPFSQDPADEFFADGMVEELLNLLAKIPDLQVAARTSSFAYKGVSNKTIVEIGTELGVDTILEGSIRKNDVTNQIRITAQLIKVSTGEHLWSETFDREYRDIFQIQDDIARAVVDKMKVTLLGNDNVNPFISDTNSVDAMVAFGKGQQELMHRTVSSLTKALAHFEQAIREDQNYARAYVGVADANILLALYGNTPKAQAKINAQNALDKAVELSPTLGEAYASLGLLWSEEDVSKAEQYFKTAIEFNANYAMTYMWYGSLLQEQGEFLKSHQLFEQAFELDPKSPVAAFNVASGHYKMGNEEKAMELFSHIIANDPYYPSAYNLVGDILTNRGRLDEAINMYKRALDIDGINQHAVKGLLIATMDMGDFDATRQWFDYIAKKEQLFTRSSVDMLQARFYASQNKTDQALVTLANIKYEEHGMGQYFNAEVALYKSEFAKGVRLLEEIQQSAKRNKNAFYYIADGQAVIHLAYGYQQLEQFDAADKLILDYSTYMQQELASNMNNPAHYYKMALIKALQNKTDEALYYLQGAIDAGWVSVWQAETELVFNEVSQLQQFGQMLGGVKAKLANMKNRINNEESFLLAESESFEAFH